MDCTQCGEPNMMFVAGEWYYDGDYQEPDAYECPECGHMEVLD